MGSVDCMHAVRRPARSVAAPGSAFAPWSLCARLPGVKPNSRHGRIVAAISAALSVSLLSTPVALADNGVGLAGPTTDKTVTFFCFGVIAFFAILVIAMSLLQGSLEKRKERRRSNLERLG